MAFVDFLRVNHATGHYVYEPARVMQLFNLKIAGSSQISTLNALAGKGSREAEEEMTRI
jgi:hypothetical protein